MASDNMQQEFDVVVVGSGPGGAMLALGLSRAGKRVLVLERGPDAPRSEGLLALARVAAAVPVGRGLSVARAEATGGTTSMYFAVASDPPLEQFASFGIDLSPALRALARDIPQCVLPDEVLCARSLRLRDAAMALGHPWVKRSMLVDAAKCRSAYVHQAKWHAAQAIKDAIACGATLIGGANVDRVLSAQGRAVGVAYSVRVRGRKARQCQAFGSRIVLAAGAGSTPHILRNSGLEHVGNGPFCCHPSFAVFGSVRGLRAGDGYTGSMGVDLADGVALGDGGFSRSFHRVFMLGNGRPLWVFRHASTVGVGVMLREAAGGGMRPDGQFHKEIEPEDLQRLTHAEELARAIVARAGGERIFRSELGAGHLGGMIRMGKHLDADLQTEMPHLHVCDGSMLPERTVSSPVLTLACLGSYLAGRLSPAV
jgi:choline dehydrogenase-like flavoprotein